MTSGRRAPRIFISAGEVSGDSVAAKLIDALMAAAPSAVVDGVGGTRMAQAGATVIAAANHIGAVGLTEGAATLPSAIRVFHTVTRHVRAHRPDVAVLIANDVFNVLLGRTLRRDGIPTISLFPPQTWIWRSVARLIVPAFDLMLTSFPDETVCYGRVGAATEFIGHYLADELEAATPAERMAARRALGLSASDPVLAIFPGSRPREVERLLPLMLGAVDLMGAEVPAAQFVTALATPLPSDGFPLRTPQGRAVRVMANSHETMRAADVIVCCSGTATLEASLIGVPMVVIYSASRTTYGAVRACIRAGLIASDTVALPNLVLGRRVVPELIQYRVTAQEIARAAMPLLTDEGRRHSMRQTLQEVRTTIERPGTLAAAARIVLERAGA
jgi:lipid-A-disaccharide synthase